MSFIESLSQVLSFERAPVPSFDILKRVASSRFDELSTAVNETTQVIDLSFPSSPSLLSLSSTEAPLSTSYETVPAVDRSITGPLPSEIVGFASNLVPYDQPSLDIVETQDDSNEDYLNFLQYDTSVYPEFNPATSTEVTEAEFSAVQQPAPQPTPTQPVAEVSPIQPVLDQDQIRARIANAYSQGISGQDSQTHINQRAA